MSWASYANLRSFGQQSPAACQTILHDTKQGIHMKPTPVGIIGSSALEGKKVIEGTLEKTTEDATNGLRLKNRALTKPPIETMPETVAYLKSGSGSKKNVY